MNVRRSAGESSLKQLLRVSYRRQLRAVLTLAACLAVEIVSADFNSAVEVYRRNEYQSAMKEFRILAEQGDARAQTVLALMYKYGEGAPLDLSRSYYWYMKAAELNYAPAQYHSGVMLAEGLGVEPDLEVAIHWLRKSAEGGYTGANDKLEEYNAARVSIDSPVDEYIPWSKHWDFSLPNDIRFPVPKIKASPGNIYYRVQLGAMSSKASADLLWRYLIRTKPANFDGFSLLIEESPRTDRTYYRVQTGPFNSLEQAKAFCNTLVDEKVHDCIPLPRQFHN